MQKKYIKKLLLLLSMSKCDKRKEVKMNHVHKKLASYVDSMRHRLKQFKIVGSHQLTELYDKYYLRVIKIKEELETEIDEDDFEPEQIEDEISYRVKNDPEIKSLLAKINEENIYFWENFAHECKHDLKLIQDKIERAKQKIKYREKEAGIRYGVQKSVVKDVVQNRAKPKESVKPKVINS